MNEFEFLRFIPFGQAVGGDSPLHRLDPRARIVIFGVLLTAVLFASHPLGLGLSLLAALAGLRLARLPVGYALRALRGPLPFLIFLAALQVLFNALPDSPPAVRVWIFTITPLDLLAGAMLLLRFAAAIVWIQFAGLLLTTSELTHGLESLLSPLEALKIPVHDAVMAVMVAVRFLPFLAQSAERIAKAQAARGAQWGGGKGGLFARTRALLPLLVPIFVTSLRRAETMALAMDARGYASRAHPTAWVAMRFTPRDSVAIGLALAVAAATFLMP